MFEDNAIWLALIAATTIIEAAASSFIADRLEVRRLKREQQRISELSEIESQRQLEAEEREYKRLVETEEREYKRTLEAEEREYKRKCEDTIGDDDDDDDSYDDDDDSIDECDNRSMNTQVLIDSSMIDAIRMMREQLEPDLIDIRSQIQEIKDGID